LVAGIVETGTTITTLTTRNTGTTLMATKSKATGMTVAKHKIAVDAIMEAVETARTKLSPDITKPDGTIEKGIVIPPTAVVRKAVEGIVAKRGRHIIVANPKTFYDFPLASVLLRLIQFHRSSGSLWGVMGATFDAGCIARWAFEDDRNPNGRIEKSGDMEIMRESYPEAPDDFKGQMDSLALVILKGQSRAADNWSRQLGTG
jgi:hypothetical protein